MNFKCLFFFTVIVLTFSQHAKAQPQCSSNIHIFETCNWEYLNREFVFVGRVVSAGVSPNSMTIPRKIIVDIETQIKGNLNNLIGVELYLDQRCEGSVQPNSRHIFTADFSSNPNFTGLLSRKWSTEMQEYTTQDTKEILSKIRLAIKNVKQSRIVGNVIQKLGKTQLLSNYNSLNIRRGYDLLSSQPSAKTEVVAKLLNGKEFKTKTNTQGEYEFKKLPNGEYEVFANLPKEFTVVSNGDFTKIIGEKKYIQIDNGICSKKVYFTTQVLGSLSGRIISNNEKWAVYFSLYLIRIDLASGKRDIFEPDFYPYTNASYSRNGSQTVADFSVEGIPVGHYILYIQSSDNRLGIFYPGVKDRNKAKIIEVKVGKPNNFTFKIQ